MRSIGIIPNLYVSYWNYDKIISEMFQSIKVPPKVMAKDYKLESKYKIINVKKCNYVTSQGGLHGHEMVTSINILWFQVPK